MCQKVVKCILFEIVVTYYLFMYRAIRYITIIL